MRHVITASMAVVTAALFLACADSTAPAPDDPRRFSLARRSPTAPWIIPDSVGIPPMPPPVFLDVPLDSL